MKILKLFKQKKSQQQSNAEENLNNSNSNSEKIIERNQIKKTPFTIISTAEGTHFIVCANYRLTELTKNKRELTDMITFRSWELITALITVSYEWLKKNEK